VLVVVRRVPPHFSIPPENAEVLPGGAVNLTCVAIGSPMPFVRWRLGALELTPEDNPPIGKNILQLDDVRETATYTCVATSDLGNIEYDAEVRVKGTALIGTNSSHFFLTIIIVTTVESSPKHSESSNLHQTAVLNLSKVVIFMLKSLQIFHHFNHFRRPHDVTSEGSGGDFVQSLRGRAKFFCCPLKL